jgi:hypothetical protein
MGEPGCGPGLAGIRVEVAPSTAAALLILLTGCVPVAWAVPVRSSFVFVAFAELGGGFPLLT